MPITHGIDESVREIEALAGKPGIKGIMIPTMWHDQPSYGHPSYDPVWAACAEAGLVVHTHSGEADTPAYNENMAQFMLEVAFWTHRPLWQLLLSGKFDRFPNLKYAPVECGSWWVGDLPVQDRRDVRGHELEGQEDVLAHEGPHRAAAVGVRRHQRVHRRVGHEQARDPPPLRQRHRRPDVGHRLPAPRGHVAQHGRAARRPTSRRVPVEETRLLLGLNAVRCYDLDLDGLADIAADIGPTPEQLNQDLDLRTPPDAIREARFWFDDYGIEWKG